MIKTMKKFGEIKSKILSKLVESYSTQNKEQTKNLLKFLNVNKDFKDMYLFYEGVEKLNLKDDNKSELYLNSIEPLLIEKLNTLQNFCKKIDDAVGNVDYEKNEIYECLDILSEKSHIFNIDKKIDARKKLVEHLKKEKKVDVVENTHYHTKNQKLLATVLTNNFNMTYESKMSDNDRQKFKQYMMLSDDDLKIKVQDIKEDILNTIDKLLTESQDSDLQNKLSDVKTQVINTKTSRYNYFKLNELKNGLD